MVKLGAKPAEKRLKSSATNHLLHMYCIMYCISHGSGRCLIPKKILYARKHGLLGCRWEFTCRFFERIARLLWAKEGFAREKERIAHVWSFVKSDKSDLLTVGHLYRVTRANHSCCSKEQLSKER